MKSAKYFDALLASIAVLLLGILLALFRNQGTGVSLEQRAFAQADQGASNVEFHPWINPRKFVFWDRQKGEIYIYDDSGKIDAIWVVGKMGEPLRKKS